MVVNMVEIEKSTLKKVIKWLDRLAIYQKMGMRDTQMNFAQRKVFIREVNQIENLILVLKDLK